MRVCLRHLLYKLSFIGLSLCLLQSCTQVIQPVEVDAPSVLISDIAGNFGARSTILSPEEIHQLSDEQKEQLLSYMNDPRNSRTKPHHRLFNYLEKVTHGFTYHDDTFTASQTLQNNSGNCLSLAILTSALAEIAGLEVGFQLVDDLPVYALTGTVVNISLHIRTIIYDPTWIPSTRLLVLSRPGIKVDYFPSSRQRLIGNMDRNRYLSMYYQNIAAEGLAANNFNSAYWHTIESLKFVPNSSIAINLLAVTNRRSGHADKAEQLYLFGIENSNEKLSLLKNYRVLLVENDLTEEALAIEKQLSLMSDTNPFQWFYLAQGFYLDGDFLQAIRYFNKALDLAPYLHEAHLGIAQSNYQQGRYSRAESALQAALENAYKVSTRNLYQAKLATLSLNSY